MESFASSSATGDDGMEAHTATLQKLAADWGMTLTELFEQASKDKTRIEQKLEQTLKAGGGAALRGTSRMDLTIAAMRLFRHSSKAPVETIRVDGGAALSGAKRAIEAEGPGLVDLYTGGHDKFRGMSRMEIAMLVWQRDHRSEIADPASDTDSDILEHDTFCTSSFMAAQMSAKASGRWFSSEATASNSFLAAASERPWR